MDSKVENKEESRDEVDFIPTSTAAKKEICVSCKSFNPLKKGFLRNNVSQFNNNATPKSPQSTNELQTAVKTHISALEKLHLFHFPLRKKTETSSSEQQQQQQQEKEKLSKNQSNQQSRPQRLIKSSSIARLFGNTYNTKKSESNNSANNSNNNQLKKSQSVSEKFSNHSNESDEEFVLRVSEHNFNLSTCTTNLSSLDLSNVPMDKPVNKKAIKSITKGLGKLLRRNHSSVEISPPDPEYKVLYLGNVLTGWAKGDACIEKPLATLWRNYTQNNKPEVLMRLRVCPSGLKATTRQHGLTEYWSHRITFCSSPKSYPKIFCWIYRHEGRKLKHELRCHAVICSKEALCLEIALQLKQNLAIALREFKRDKINKQNARLSLANAADDNPSMPRRKILLSTGANNYRPPLERSKSAPKLFSIEEMVDEEDEEELSEESKAMKSEERKKRDEIKPCCKEDHLYPSVTLGRRRCRRGHSIRKSRLLRGTILTQKSYPPTYKPSYNAPSSTENIAKSDQKPTEKEELEVETSPSAKPLESSSTEIVKAVNQNINRHLGSDEDFESFLLCNNYDSKDPLSTDLMSYFEMKLQTPTTESALLAATTTTASMSDLFDDEILLRNQRTCMSMSDLIDYQSDNELEDNESDIYFNQDSLLDTLRRQSTKTVVNACDIDDGKSSVNCDESVQSFIHDDTANKRADDDFEINSENCDYTMEPTHRHQFNLFKRPAQLGYCDDDLTSESPSSLCMSEKTICVNLDSDEGSSISSGCETSSTVTTNAEENHLPRRGSVLDRVRTFEQMAESQHVTKKEDRSGSGKFYLRISTNSHNSGSKSGSFILSQPESNVKVTRGGTLTKADNNANGVSRRIKIDDDSDELSDESGYVEFQDLSLKSTFA